MSEFDRYIEKYQENNINILYSTGLVLISAAISFAVYLKSNQDFDSLLITIYLFGLLSLTGIFVVFPGGARTKNEWGDKVRVGNINSLSKTQVLTILVWFIGFGAYLVYRIEVKNTL